MNKNIISGSLLDNIEDLTREGQFIDHDRKKLLEQLAENIHLLLTDRKEASVLFVCTHNSRRSQLAEIWLQLAVDYHHLKHIHSYSGGTEATAFNIRMVMALKRFGIDIDEREEGTNPKYILTNAASMDMSGLMFSKVFDDSTNPKENFIAVMVCNQADDDCPFIPGAFARFSLPYEDPKGYDMTDNESMAYDGKVREIGREMLYMVDYLKSMSSDSLGYN